MRVKTSLWIEKAVLTALAKAAPTQSRSRLIEDPVRELLARRAGSAREAQDLAILNDAADALNREMEDVLAYRAVAEPAAFASRRSQTLRFEGPRSRHPRAAP